MKPLFLSFLFCYQNEFGGTYWRDRYLTNKVVLEVTGSQVQMNAWEETKKPNSCNEEISARRTNPETVLHVFIRQRCRGKSLGWDSAYMSNHTI